MIDWYQSEIKIETSLQRKCDQFTGPEFANICCQNTVTILKLLLLFKNIIISLRHFTAVFCSNLYYL